LGKIPLAQAWLEVSRALDEKQKKVHCILIATPAGKTYASAPPFFFFIFNLSFLFIWLIGCGQVLHACGEQG
jgi:hypothetical protein